MVAAHAISRLGKKKTLSRLSNHFSHASAHWEQNRSDKDHATHWHSSRGGYLVLTHKDASGERPVGLVLPIIYPNKTGWVGFFVVEEAYRGTGGGRLLFQAALDTFKQHGVEHVGLDGVLQQISTYQRRGFVEAGRVKLMVTKPIRELTVPAQISEEIEAPVHLKSLKDVKPAAVEAMDEKVTGLKRADLWTKELLTSRPDAWGSAIEGEDGEVLGFILVRSCENGYRIGPLYVGKRSWAKVLLWDVMKKIKHLDTVAEDSSLIAEVWGENADAIGLFEELGWEYSGVDYARMWLDGKDTAAQKKGAVADTQAFAWFDAGEG